MRHATPWTLGGLCVALGVLLALVFPQAWAVPEATSPAESLRHMRPGYLASHQVVSVTAASAASTVLLQGSTYRVICSTDVYMDQGPSTMAATTSEAFLPLEATEWVIAETGYLYLAFIRKTADGTCYISEVK